MGRPKLALPLGNSTVLERVIAVLREASVTETLVVLGPHVAQLRTAAERAGASVLTLTQETPDMRTTVERGLDWFEAAYRPTADDAWLLAPADHPTLEVAVVHALLRKRAEHADASILVPTYNGKRGHPTLIGWRHRAAIREFPQEQGLNAFLRGRADVTLEVSVASAEVLCDLDTPEDYERLLRRWSSQLY